MVRVPAGSFTMGSDSSEPDERPERTVKLGEFSIDRYEVTQAQYDRCVKAGVCPVARRFPGCVGPGLPVVGVSWHDARRYCRWSGKRLPTEAEWERAARGTDGRRYPWGARLDCSKANFGNFSGAGPCSRKNPGQIIPPGKRPGGVSPAGAHDLAGNVWEWVSDDDAGYRERADPGQRVVRGGSCCSYFAMPTTTNRLRFSPDYRDRDLGFRCATSPGRSAGRAGLILPTPSSDR
jgi:formylglycine-generating enzyme required for sulfatase activity